MKPDESTIKAFRDAIALDAQAVRIALVSGIKPSVIKPEITGLTEFEINVIARAFALGEFNPVRLGMNLEFIAVHFIKAAERSTTGR